MTVQGGIIEQKTIGIKIGTSGNFFNTEYVNGVIQLTKASSDPNSIIYNSNGRWESEIIDIGDNFESYGKLLITEILNGESETRVYTRTSSNAIIFGDWQEISQTNDILSQKNRYIQVAIDFIAGKINGMSNVTTVIKTNTFTDEILTTSPTYLVPVMTSNISDEGIAFASSEFSAANAPWKAFDNLTSTFYRGITNEITIKHGFIFTNPKLISGYYITSPNSSGTRNYTPKSWIIQASNDTTNGLDGTWITIDNRTNELFETNSLTKTYSFENNNYYKAYRIDVLENNGNISYTGFSEFNWLQPALPEVGLKLNYETNNVPTVLESGYVTTTNYTIKDWNSFYKIRNQLKL